MNITETIVIRNYGIDPFEVYPQSAKTDRIIRGFCTSDNNVSTVNNAFSIKDYIN